MSISTDVLASGGLDQLASPVPFAALTLVIVTAIWSTYYLNKAMILFRNSEVRGARQAEAAPTPFPRSHPPSNLYPLAPRLWGEAGQSRFQARTGRLVLPTIV
jgi:hypothetical protein